MNPLDLIPGIWGYVAGLVTLLGAIWGVYRHGKKVANDQHEMDKHNEYIATQKRIADALLQQKRDRAAGKSDADWLHDRHRKS